MDASEIICLVIASVVSIFFVTIIMLLRKWNHEDDSKEQTFKGSMIIFPKCEEIQPFIIYGDWYYKPQNNCWYNKGKAYPADICQIIEEKDKI